MITIPALTLEQEYNILTKLNNANFIDNGGGRAVFGMTSAELVKCGLPNIFTKEEYVVKVAFDNGIEQNLREIDLYQEHGDHAPLAEIVFRGRHIEIMERVSTFDFRDYEGLTYDIFIECIEEDFGDRFSRQEIDAAYDVMNELGDFNGYTSDNGQLGMTADGLVVAYDYGFTTEYECSEQTSENDLYDYEELLEDLIAEVGAELDD